MRGNRYFRFPRALRDFRVAAGMQQQILASRVGMGGAALCALEKGRRPIPSADRIEAMAAVLGLGRDELANLHRWAEHDRLVTYLERQGLFSAIPLLSQALQVSWLCNERQASAVCASLARHAGALTHLASLDRELTPEEAAM